MMGGGDNFLYGCSCVSQVYQCPILQLPFEYRTGDKHGPGPLSPSIDRAVPELGYTQGNVSIISYKANTIKNNCTNPAVFRRLADWIEKNNLS
jgi:hypothetical protein